MLACVWAPTFGFSLKATFASFPLAAASSLRNALYIEAEDAGIETDVDFPITFSYACKNNLRGRKASVEYGLNLASADTIHSQSGFTDDVQHLGVGIGFHGIMNMPVIMSAHLVVNGTKRLAKQGRIIVVEGCLLQFEFLYREIAFHVFDVESVLRKTAGDTFYLLNNVSLNDWRARCLSASRMRKEIL